LKTPSKAKFQTTVDAARPWAAAKQKNIVVAGCQAGKRMHRNRLYSHAVSHYRNATPTGFKSDSFRIRSLRYVNDPAS